MICIEGLEVGEFQFRHQQDMHRIAWLGVMKGEQRLSFAQAFCGDKKTHFREEDMNEKASEGSVEETVEGVHL